MMPQWLAKTPEMYAFDQYFSLENGEEEREEGQGDQPELDRRRAGFVAAKAEKAEAPLRPQKSRPEGKADCHHLPERFLPPRRLARPGVIKKALRNGCR